MEFVADPTEQQLAQIERGLEEYNAGVASARTVTRVRAVCVESGDVIAGLEAAAYWESSTSGCCGCIPATSTEGSAANW